MSLSAFSIIGPVMVGPSSSHTAGAVRLGLLARALLGSHEPTQATIGLHGSFQATGHGHGTKLALIAGLLGFSPEDERLVLSAEFAKMHGLSFNFHDIDLGDEAHPNSACIDLESANGERHLIIGSSVGGGSIQVTSIDRFNAYLNCDDTAIIVWHLDRVGYLASLTATLANAGANIVSIHTHRSNRGDRALTTIELDGKPPRGLQERLQANNHTSRVRIYTNSY